MLLDGSQAGCNVAQQGVGVCGVQAASAHGHGQGTVRRAVAGGVPAREWRAGAGSTATTALCGSPCTPKAVLSHARTHLMDWLPEGPPPALAGAQPPGGGVVEGRRGGYTPPLADAAPAPVSVEGPGGAEDGSSGGPMALEGGLLAYWLLPTLPSVEMVTNESMLASAGLEPIRESTLPSPGCWPLTFLRRSQPLPGRSARKASRHSAAGRRATGEG